MTPWSRIAAMVGALSAVTLRARRPSGTKRIMLWGVSATAAVIAQAVRINAKLTRFIVLSFLIGWVIRTSAKITV